MPESFFESQRDAEIDAGRARVEERMKTVKDVPHKVLAEHKKRAEQEFKESMERRTEILELDLGLGAKAERDRAGAEVIDQAQTSLEAIGHLADREERITTLVQQLEMEALEGNADPGAATELTVAHVTAQAVNQPTILANNEGKDTENKPLNNTDFPDETLSQATPVPKELHVPKTRPNAEKVAKAKVPPAEQVVKQGFENEAVKVLKKAPRDTFGADVP